MAIQSSPLNWWCTYNLFFCVHLRIMYSSSRTPKYQCFRCCCQCHTVSIIVHVTTTKSVRIWWILANEWWKWWLTSLFVEVTTSKISICRRLRQAFCIIPKTIIAFAFTNCVCRSAAFMILSAISWIFIYGIIIVIFLISSEDAYAVPWLQWHRFHIRY